MERRFSHIVIRHRLIAEGEGVLVALSGGPDSVALLSLLLGLADSWRLQLRAAHLDHGIREESAADADFVRRLCANWNVPLKMRRVDVPGAIRQGGGGIEETARDLRRSFLLEAASEHGCGVIALGHHRDDQAETLLQRLLRGSGPTGLAAMRYRSSPFIRPLLIFSRAEILAYLQRQGIGFVEDVSNEDCRFSRNRIRHRLLPMLREFNPVVEEHLSRLADFFATEEDYWRREVERLAPAVADGVAGGWRISLDRWQDFPVAVQRRLLRYFLEIIRERALPLSWRQFEMVEKVLNSSNPHAETSLPGFWAGRDYNRLWLLDRRPAFPQPFVLKATKPGVEVIPGVGRLELILIAKPLGEDRWSVEFDADKVSFPLSIRSYRAGDRFQPAGMEGRKKVKELFIDCKLGLRQRYRVPLVLADDLLWVAGLRRSARYPVVSETKRVLRVTFIPALSPNLSL